MFISRESDYAIRSVRALQFGEQIHVSDICEAEHIPLQYAYKILRKLEHAGLVESHCGARGGFRLLRQLSELTLFDIISAVDDEFPLNGCMKDGFVCTHNDEGKHCGVHKELCRLQSIIVETLRAKPMSEVLKDASA